MRRFRSAESQDVTSSRIRLLVRVSHSHPTSSCNIETGEVAHRICDRDETDIVTEDIDVVDGRDRNGNLELRHRVSTASVEKFKITRTFRGR